MLLNNSQQHEKSRKREGKKQENPEISLQLMDKQNNKAIFIWLELV